MKTSLQLVAAVVLVSFVTTGEGVSLPEDYVPPGTTTRLTWDYASVANWPTLFADYCAGTSQSPINLERLTTVWNIFWPIKFTNYEVVPTKQTITNNGHSVTITYESTDTPQISNGGLPDDGPYNLAQWHLHWGSDSTQGSEHTINSVKYPMELHLVHYKRVYDSLTNAIQHSDGLAVLGVMFEIGKEDNPALAPLMAQINTITTNGGTADQTDFYAFSSLIPKDYTSFYRYSGGLTTPTCNEIVTWTVFTDTLKISEAQLTTLRTLQDAAGAPIQDNYRPVQPINKRIVYRSFKNDKTDG